MVYEVRYKYESAYGKGVSECLVIADNVEQAKKRAYNQKPRLVKILSIRESNAVLVQGAKIEVAK